MPEEEDVLHDVFISYHHKDNVPIFGSKEGWVTLLDQTLNYCLRTLLANPRIWRDPKMSESDLLRENIFKNLRRSLTLVAVLTPGYFHVSEWCPKELSMFRKEVGEAYEGKSRVFWVLKSPPVDYEVPKILDDSTLGFKFFEENLNNEIPSIFEPAMGEEMKQKFLEQVYKLSFRLAQTLKLLKGSAPDPNLQTGIFMADPTSDLKEKFENVKWDLLARGYRITPSKDLPKPMRADDYTKLIRRSLEDCRLGVHLVGNEYSGRPPDSEFSYLQLQTRVSAERLRDKNFYRLIWLPNDVEVHDDRHRQFIGQLLDSPEYNSDLFRGSLEDLKTRIQEILAARSPAVVSSEKRVNTAELQKINPNYKSKKKVYLIYLTEDISAARDLIHHINRHPKGFLVKPSSDYLVERDRLDIIEADKQYLRDCDIAIIYWNSAVATWVRQRESDFLRIMGDGRQSDFTDKAIFIAGKSEAKDAYGDSTEEKILRNLDELDTFLDNV